MSVEPRGLPRLTDASASRYAAPAMAFHREVAAAVGDLTVFTTAGAAASRAERAGGLVFYPAVGLGLGALAALAAVAVATWLPAAAGPAGVLALVALSGGQGPRDLAASVAVLGPCGSGAAPAAHRAAGVALAFAALAGRAAAAVALPPPARTTALLLAPMLGAWAIAVQCYGGVPLDRQDPPDALVGRARFREFGWASVVALGVTLTAGEALGLIVVLAAALTTLGVRVVAHRRLGGLGGPLLGATRELVETAVLAALGVLAALAG